jgi:tetratricopeptide (TPR) repeat protein
MATKQSNFGQGPEMLRELWLYHFMGKEEREQLLNWLAQEGLTRPERFEDRVKHAEYLRNLGNDWYHKEDFRRALHCVLGAVHCLDYPPLWQQDQSEEQRRELAEAMLPVMSNLSMVCLKRGDFQSADTAASSGLLVAKKLLVEETAKLCSKLHYRRALARGEQGPQRDYDGAHSDLVEAARLDPSNREIRACLKQCNDLRQQERREAYLKGPRFDVPKKDSLAQAGEGAEVAQEASAEDLGEAPLKSTELSPALELFASCVGKCLGRSRRWCRYARHHGCNRFWIKLAMLILLFGFVGAMPLYVATEHCLIGRVIFLFASVAFVLCLKLLFVQATSIAPSRAASLKQSKSE